MLVSFDLNGQTLWCKHSGAGSEPDFGQVLGQGVVRLASTGFWRYYCSLHVRVDANEGDKPCEGESGRI